MEHVPDDASLAVDSARFPNTRSRPATTIATSDGPSSSSSRTPAQPLPDGAGTAADPDTCRICRGEGTPEEPLFYPCKCSGSIKYVHQECLMEWLSHSQKKHCELCKTPFRFTKLYAPDMPKDLPFYVFISHMAKYTVRNLLVWLRAALVISVWLGWLPYLMRSVWSFLFWISDEGLGGGPMVSWRQASANASTASSSAVPFGSTVCASSPLFERTTTAAAVLGAGAVAFEYTEILRLQTTFNSSRVDPLYTAFLKLFGGLGGSLGASKTKASNVSSIPPNMVRMGSARRHPSLLSEVPFFKNLTRHSAINRIVIAVLEGQIITILVVVCFILIILVRDYVVQQQPEINMRAAFAAENGAPARAPVQPGRVEPIPPLAGPNDPTVDIDVANDTDADNELPPLVAGSSNDEDGQGQERLPDDHENSGAMRRRRVAGAVGDGFGGLDPVDEEARGSSSEAADIASSSSQPRFDSWSASNPIRNPPRRNSDRDTSDLPHIEGATVQEYLRLYREAGGDPEKILLLAKEQHLEQKLEYWMRLTKSLRDRDRREPAPGRLGRSEVNKQERPIRDAHTETDDSGTRAPRATVHVEASPTHPNWEWPEDWATWTRTPEKEKGKENEEVGEAKGKGKEKAHSEDNNIDLEFTGDDPTGGPSHHAPVFRPRSNTDGPKVNDTFNPLANDNWSFPELPVEEPPTAPNSASFGEPLARSQLIMGGDVDTPDDSEGGFPTPSSSTLAEFGSSPTRNASPNGFDASDGEGSSTPAPPPETEHPTQPDAPSFDLNTARQAGEAVAPRPPPAGLMNRVTEFMWRDVDAIEPAELAHWDRLEDFLDVDNEDMDELDIPRAIVGGGLIPRDDPEVVAAAEAAGLDPEAIDDAEDLEGVMELLGMRGPIAGLFQNAIFCAFLVSITIFLGIFVPYNVGRITVWTIANPMRPARMLVGLSKFLQDCALVILGVCSCAMSYVVRLLTQMLGSSLGRTQISSVVGVSWQMAKNAAARIADSFMSELPIISTSEMRNFSALSHEALLMIKGHISSCTTALGEGLSFLFGGDYSAKSTDVVALASNVTAVAWAGMKDLPELLSAPGSWVINFSLPDAGSSVDPDLAYWNGTDRFWAVACGYGSLSVLAALYLRRGTPFSSGPTGQEWEASLMDGLNQASGVMKVILIIGIEMLVFPLYCGLLLDVALLPLFENTSILSRFAFTCNFPLTSIFVHWFVGTGYMFHFALFVSMCRKIMRKGVLYFIRDPDDPEFHPVRDVLERNVTTQLRKILFSAFVYGALVIICLGGVVWGLTCTLPNVFPIHYSSDEPVFEFPIDLLFFNFLIPLAVRFFRPSDGLHAMYTWWFRKCARCLRITWFLFGERRIDEEGVLRLREDSRHRKASWWRTVLLELDPETNEVVPKTWRDAFDGGKAKPTGHIATDDMITLNVQKINLVNSEQLIPSGRFVRTPASDQVKIPKGRRVFLDVTEANTRLDGRVDRAETDLYSTDQYQFVYVPPSFRARVFLFILFIWGFAAITGVGITIVPLVFGRYMFKMLIPAHIRTNDIYAFNIGIFVLGAATYTAVHARSIWAKASLWIEAVYHNFTNHDAIRRATQASWRAAKFLYAYFFLLVVFPLLVASLMELYALVPLHTYMYSVLLAGAESTATTTAAGGNATVNAITKALDHTLDDAAQAVPASFLQLNPKHSIRVIQAWTIGLLYLKLGERIITNWFDGTRLAAAVRAVLRRGWLDPDVAILTRAFVVPGLAVWFVAVAAPLLFARFTVAYGLADAILQASTGTTAALVEDLDPMVAGPLRDAYLVLIYRLSFPVVAVAVVVGAMMWGVVGVFRRWRVRIRDEAYLIGERLHNFGVARGMASRRAGVR